MDLLQLHTHRLTDGSRILLCYLEDSHYSLDTERRWLSIHKLDSRGKEVHRQQMVRDVYLHHRFVGDYLVLLDDPVDSYSQLITEDPQNGQLYICTQSGSTSGYRIHMDSWQVTATIPGLAAYLPQTGQILQWDFYTGELLASPIYTREELMTQTRQLLGTD